MSIRERFIVKASTNDLDIHKLARTTSAKNHSDELRFIGF